MRREKEEREKTYLRASENIKCPGVQGKSREKSDK